MDNEARTKIICTIGPSCEDDRDIARLAAAGMDIVRINTSHTSLEKLECYASVVKSAEGICEKSIATLLDLQGPRIRIAHVAGGEREIESGSRIDIVFTPQPANPSAIQVSEPVLADALSSGDIILANEGLIRLRVIEKSKEAIKCVVEQGGKLKQGKGINVPGIDLPLPAFTERDARYLEKAISLGVDWIAQSFVRSASDVAELKKEIKRQGASTPIMAKIESRAAYENIDEIMGVADGVMVARGDLGVELEVEEVPVAQKKIIRKALLRAVPVVTATQMLESMIENPRPTRAEASDVANAILDGSDAVMLSAETAIGKHPLAAVEVMDRIIRKAESSIDYETLLEAGGKMPHRSVADAIGYSACKIAWDLKADAIITITKSGYTPRLISRYRPTSRIIAISTDESVIRRTKVLWGVEGIVLLLEENLKEALSRVLMECRDFGLLQSGDLVVMTGGFLEEKAGTTNTVSVRTVP